MASSSDYAEKSAEFCGLTRPMSLDQILAILVQTVDIDRPQGRPNQMRFFRGDTLTDTILLGGRERDFSK